jgi:hypothetical protein
VELPEALQGKKRMEPTDELRFGCHPGVPCFNVCCHDVNIVLTPVDVLRLSRRVGLSTTDFISQHTLAPITKELKLPVLLLKMQSGADKACPFLGAAGCTVYADRPWACRMYPLAMALPPARAGEEPQPQFFLFEDDFCKGHAEPNRTTVAGWREDQGVTAREELEEGFRSLVSHPWFIGGRQLNPPGIEMFFMATYDLDAFRRFVLESTFLRRFEVEAETVDSLRTDDEALIRFGTRWLRYSLFGEPTIAVRPGAQEARRKK